MQPRRRSSSYSGRDLIHSSAIPRACAIWAGAMRWLKLYDFLMDPTALPEGTRKALGLADGERKILASRVVSGAGILKGRRCRRC